ncbi:protein TPR1-like isoform X2 [Momordica charantia]|uniref:Protein TPR1-like isoform X2 n=1 Tax=Momordica charantia TaxID=3673 RepID=A0A6J1CDK2_MOMCH|nr:protein TPR1-like isoform X2 [Momordica charantia]
MATDPDRGILFLILHYLDQQNLSETARSLECETGLYFNMSYFEEMLNCCAYNEAESYLCGFTDIHDNLYSTKIYFGIRKLKFLEALADGEREIAREVVENDIEIFSEYNPGSHRLLSSYKNLKEARKVVMANIKRCINANPLFEGKLTLPPLPTTLQRLYTEAMAGRGFFNGREVPPATCRRESND